MESIPKALFGSRSHNAWKTSMVETLIVDKPGSTVDKSIWEGKSYVE